MKEFFKVKSLNEVFAHIERFGVVGAESVPLLATPGRILAEEITADLDLPGFARATMDGYAVGGASTFGASEANPAYLNVVGSIAMGEVPAFAVGPGDAARIATGGMLPEGADAVVMIEHTEKLDEATIEVYKSVAPGQHMVAADEDFGRRQRVLTPGLRIRAQETGLMAAFGRDTVKVFRKPVIGIISTGDEVVPIDQMPARGQVRDVNSYTLSGQIKAAGAEALLGGIVPDNFEALLQACRQALKQCDMVMLSGGSSVGTRDYTIEVFKALPQARVLVRGIAISPGKPAILAASGAKAVWGLPGHVVSAMVVFEAVVKPFVEHIAGLARDRRAPVLVPARLSRDLVSAQGRTDFVRVRLEEKEGVLTARPVLGKSGLLNTMVRADGLMTIDANTEGLSAGARVQVMLF